jgi:hypothetical protein
MAFTATGYDGTVDELGFAQLMLLAGNRHTVPTRASFAATQVGGSRAISLTAGQAYAPGVRVSSDAAVRVDLPAPAAGQWHLIVLRRAWSTNAVTVEALTSNALITTTATPTAIPATSMVDLNSSPGATDDQPLYWAWVNNATVAVALVDLREVAGAHPRKGTAAARDAWYGTINASSAIGQFHLHGSQWYNTTLGATETFYGAFNSTNVTGVSSPGWYTPGTRVQRMTYTTDYADSILRNPDWNMAQRDATLTTDTSMFVGSSDKRGIVIQVPGLYALTFSVDFTSGAVQNSRNFLQIGEQPDPFFVRSSWSNQEDQGSIVATMRLRAGQQVNTSFYKQTGNVQAVATALSLVRLD